MENLKAQTSEATHASIIKPSNSCGVTGVNGGTKEVHKGRKFPKRLRSERDEAVSQEELRPILDNAR